MSRFAPISRGRQAAQRTLATLALATAGAACAAAPAEAGTYRVYVCKAPNGTPIPLDRSQWVRSISRPYSTAEEGCASGDPISLFMGSPGATHYRPGEAARWVFSPPVPVTGVTVRRSVSTRPDGGDLSATPEYRAVARNTYSSTIPLETCAANSGCQLGSHSARDSAVNGTRWEFPAKTYALEFFVHCGGDPAGHCANGGSERIVASFSRFEFDAQDDAKPWLDSSTLVGTLLESGEQKGRRSLRFAAGDWMSGLYDATVSLGGRIVHQTKPLNGGTCVDAGFHPGPDFRSFKPCTTTAVPVEFELDSSEFRDGDHTLRVDLTDAAGNTSRVVEEEVRFENHPAPRSVTPPTIGGSSKDPRPNDQLTAANGLWDGTSLTFSYQWQRSTDGAAWANIPKAITPGYLVTMEDLDRSLRVVVTASSIEGTTSVATDATSKVRSGATVVPAGGSGPPGETGSNGAGGDPFTAQLVVDREQRTVDVKHGAKIVIAGRLVDADNQPIADAEVDVFEQLVLTAAPWQKIGTVKTDSQGGYVFRPKTTASRRLRFAFADRRDAANYRATREVLVSVQAAMSISARRRVLKPGGMIRLRGRVTVDSLPKTGTWVEVQVLDAGVWRTVATRKTSSKGLWTFKHRLRQSAGVSFRFRARLRVVGDVASAEAKSAPVKVRVR